MRREIQTLAGEINTDSRGLTKGNVYLLGYLRYNAYVQLFRHVTMRIIAGRHRTRWRGERAIVHGTSEFMIERNDAVVGKWHPRIRDWWYLRLCRRRYCEVFV